MRLLILSLIGLAVALPAQDLKLYYRQAAEGGVSKIYLVGVNPKAKLMGQPCNGGEKCFYPQVLLLLPKPGRKAKPLELSGSVRVCNSVGARPECPKLKTLDGKPFKAPFIELTTDETSENKLNAYPGHWEDGRRFEAILTLKNLWIDGVPTTQTVNIPSTLQLTFDEDDSIYEDGIVTFRVVYVPQEYEGELGNKDFWTLRGNATGVELEGVSKFERDTRALRFYLPNMVRQPETALEFAPGKDRATVTRIEADIFKRLPAPGVQAQLSTEEIQKKKEKEIKIQNARVQAVTQKAFRYARKTMLGGAAPGVSQKPQPGRHRPFKTNAAVVNQDLPVYIRGVYTNNRGKKTGQHVFNVEASFAADNEFSLPPVWQNALNQIVLTPHLKLDVNTARTLDNPNSIVWSLPLTFRHYFPGQYTASNYQAPHFRLLSFGTGIEGEHSGYGQSQNVLIPLNGLLRYSTRPGAWRFGFDLKGGAEIGHSLSESIEKLALEDPEAVTNPATFVRTLRAENRNIRRLATEAKFNLTQGKKVSIQGQWQFRKLYREEQYISEREVKGAFAPDAGEKFFGLSSVRDSYTVLDTGYDMRIRRYAEASVQYAVTENISVELVYKRGVKPPTFQMVNFVSVGFSFSMGKPKE